MADRFNKCSAPQNPSSLNTNKWTTSYGSPTGGGLNFGTYGVPRNYGWRYTTAGSLLSPVFQSGGSIAGQQWTASGWLQRVAASTGTATVTIEWLNSGGTQLSTSVSGTFNIPATGVIRASVTATAPANATGFRARFSTPAPANSSQEVNCVLFERGALSTYFDGDGDDSNPADNSTAQYSWDGVDQQSTSTFYDIITKATSDSGVLTEDNNADVQAQVNPVDTFTGSEMSDVQAQTDTTDTGTSTDSSDLFVPIDRTETGIFTEGISQVDIIYYPEGSDTSTFADTSSLSTDTTTSDTATGTDTSDTLAQVPTSESGTFSESALINVQTTDSGTFSESYADIAQTRTDSGTSSDDQDLFVYIETGDTFIGDDRVEKLRRDPLETEDLFPSREPAYTKRRNPFRVLAQDIFTRRFVHMDVPVINPELDFTLTGPNLFNAVLKHDDPSMQNLEFPLEPYRTWLHVEEDYVIRQSTILQPFVDDNKTRERRIEAEGFSWYPKEIYYQGDPYAKIQIDPADIIRYIWSHIQSYPDGNLGVVVSNTQTPVRIGTEPKTTEFETGTGEQVSFESGPYDLNWWEVTNLGTEIEKLCKETPLEYIEASAWNSDRTDINCQIQMGYPRIGSQRKSIYFKEGMNLIGIIPNRTENKDVWKSDIIVVGAGEGAKAIRGYASERTGRLRRTQVLENEDITDQKRAQAIADFEKARRKRARYTIDAIVVDTAHSNAPWGTFMQGDDILVEGTVLPNEKIADWSRITAYKYLPRTKRAVLNLSPSESFTYGAVSEVDS